MEHENKPDAHAYVDATSAAIGLTIPEEYREGVVASFRQLADTAALVMSFPIGDDIDPAPVFRP